MGMFKRKPNAVAGRLDNGNIAHAEDQLEIPPNSEPRLTGAIRAPLLQTLPQADTKRRTLLQRVRGSDANPPFSTPGHEPTTLSPVQKHSGSGNNIASLGMQTPSAHPQTSPCLVNGSGRHVSSLDPGRSDALINTLTNNVTEHQHPFSEENSFMKPPRHELSEDTASPPMPADQQSSELPTHRPDRGPFEVHASMLPQMDFNPIYEKSATPAPPTMTWLRSPVRKGMQMFHMDKHSRGDDGGNRQTNGTLNHVAAAMPGHVWRPPPENGPIPPLRRVNNSLPASLNTFNGAGLSGQQDIPEILRPGMRPPDRVQENLRPQTGLPLLPPKPDMATHAAMVAYNSANSVGRKPRSPVSRNPMASSPPTAPPPTGFRRAHRHTLTNPMSANNGRNNFSEIGGESSSGTSGFENRFIEAQPNDEFVSGGFSPPQGPPERTLTASLTTGLAETRELERGDKPGVSVIQFPNFPTSELRPQTGPSPPYAPLNAGPRDSWQPEDHGHPPTTREEYSSEESEKLSSQGLSSDDGPVSPSPTQDTEHGGYEGNTPNNEIANLLGASDSKDGTYKVQDRDVDILSAQSPLIPLDPATRHDHNADGEEWEGNEMTAFDNAITIRTGPRVASVGQLVNECMRWSTTDDNDMDARNPGDEETNHQQGLGPTNEGANDPEISAPTPTVTTAATALFAAKDTQDAKDTKDDNDTEVTNIEDTKDKSQSTGAGVAERPSTSCSTAAGRKSISSVAVSSTQEGIGEAKKSRGKISANIPSLFSRKNKVIGNGSAGSGQEDKEADLATKAANLEKIIKTLENEKKVIPSLKTTIQELETKNKTLKASNSQLKRQSSRVQELESENRTLKQSNADLQSQNMQFSTNNKTLVSSINILEKEKADLQKDRDILADNNSTLSAWHSAAESKKKDYEVRLAGQNEQCYQFLQGLFPVQQRLEDGDWFQIMMNSLPRLLEQEKQKLIQTEERAAKAEASVEEKNNENLVLHTQLKHHEVLKRQYSALEDKSKEQEELAHELKGELLAARSEAKHTREANKQTSEENARLVSECAQKTQKVKEAQGTIETLQAHVSVLELDKHELSQDNATLQHSLQEQQIKYDTKVRTMQDTHDNKEQEMQTVYNDKVNEMQQEQRSLERRARERITKAEADAQQRVDRITSETNSLLANQTIQYEDKIATMTEKSRQRETEWQEYFNKEVSRLQTQLKDDARRAEREKDDLLAAKDARHDEESRGLLEQIARLTSEVDEIAARTRIESADKISQLKTDKSALQRKLAVHSTALDYKALPDNNLGSAFSSLTQRVNNLVVHIRKPPDGYRLENYLDPNDFLGRRVQKGGGSSRNWPKFVRYICWQVLLRGFFLLPDGFGVFGSEGEGQEDLFQFYSLFATSSTNGTFSSTHSPVYSFSISKFKLILMVIDANGALVLPKNAKTNSGRAWFFDGVLHFVKSSSATDSHETEKYRRFFWANVNRVGDELVQTLRYICNDQMDSRALGQIASLVHDVGILALEMASQRAHVYLEQCGHGDPVTAGAHFKDDRGSAGSEGAMVKVDLMTQPCMMRVGDGSADLASEKVLVKGEVVALR